jgi:hypothetical protein
MDLLPAGEWSELGSNLLDNVRESDRLEWEL